MGQKPVLFRKEIAPLEKDKLTYRIPSNGTIDKLTVRFYPGPEGDLRIRPLLINYSDQPQRIVHYAEGGKDYISGENDEYNYPVSIAVQIDDEIHIYYENLDATNTYSLVVDVVLTEGR